MANFLTNLVSTQIASKRLSGKAHTNANLEISGESIGSTVQTIASTVFGEVLPNNPNNTWATHKFLIQSESSSDPGTVQLVEFEISTASFGTYVNSTDPDAGQPGGDMGETTVDTYHAYALRLTGSYESEANNNLDTEASTDFTLGNGVFQNNYHLSGSRGKLQIVPEYVSNIPAGVGSSNPYTPVLIASDETVISGGSDIDWYLDPYSGILFIQDPVDFLTGNASLRPAKVRAFIFTGKYQDEVVSGDVVDLAISDGTTNFSITNTATSSFVTGSGEGLTISSSNDGTNSTLTFELANVVSSSAQLPGFHISASTSTSDFSIDLGGTASFEDGGAGITVETVAGNIVQIGKTTDNVTFNNITATGDIIAQNYIVSSSVTYMTQSFSSGSTIFGDTVGGANADTHQFTGSIFVTGSTFTWDGLGSSANITPLVIDSSGNITTGSAYATSESLALLSSSFENVSASFAIVSESFATVSSSVSTNTDNITELQASSSAGIFFSGSGGGFSIPTTHTASFSASGAGLTVSVASDEVEYIVDPNTLIEAVDTVTIINITASYAASASTVYVDDNEDANDNFPIIFHSPTTADNYVNLQSDASRFTYNPSIAQLTLGNTTSTLLVINSQSIDVSLSSNGNFDLLTTPGTINFGADSDLITYGTANNTTHKLRGEVIFDGVSNINPLTLRTAQFTSSIDIDFIHPDSGSFYIRNISQSAESTPLVIDSEGKITKNTLSFATIEDLGNYTASLSASIIGTANEVEVTAPNPGEIQIGLPNDVIISGSLTVGNNLYVSGTLTSINVDNLNIEDQFILLSSGSDSIQDSGIIVAYGGQSGPALYYDSEGERWAVNGKNSAVDWNATSATPDQWIVTVSSSNATPTGTPSDFGDTTPATYALGMMYIDTGDNDGDGNNIWIYA